MRKLLFIIPLLIWGSVAKAQTPPVCTFAQVAFNSVNNTFEYHCPNTNNWFPATVNGTGGGSGPITGGLQDPGANGIVLRVALNTTTTAAASDIVALFGGGCGISSFLRGDGTCQTVATFTYPPTGVPVSVGTSGPWSTSLQVGTAASNLVQLDGSGHLPAVSAQNLTNFPTFNQSTTGNAATATALSATPSLCTTGQAPTGILTNGNATGCAAIGGGSGLSGMTAGQIPVAATNSTVTSSVATTGSGNVVLATAPTLSSPVLTTPNLGTPSAINLSNATGAPTWNQNTSGTAANLSGTPALPNGTTATSQVESDSSTKLATTAFVAGITTLASLTSVNGTTVPASATLTTTIASGTATMGTGAISSSACATVVTVSATGTATTDNIQADFNTDPTGTTGYVPGAMLTIVKYPTLNNVNFKVCNNTAVSVTPSAVTLNWRVVR